MGQKIKGIKIVKINFKRYLLYLMRWQLSTPILAFCMVLFLSLGTTWATVIANLIGGMIFYFVDKFIFQSRILNSSWQIKENISCVDCDNICRGYRLVESENYNKISDKNPEFRCEKCSESKSQVLRANGVIIK
jgi:hypothetical protein